MSTVKDRVAAWRARKRDAGLPVEDREAARARKAEWRAKQKAAGGVSKRKPRRKGPRPYWGIDGEGCGVDEHGRQNYMLLCAGDDDEYHELYTGKPLSTYNILTWILSLPAEPELIGFSFGYDITQILRDIPSAIRKDILAAEHEDEADGGKREWPGFVWGNDAHTKLTYAKSRRSKYTYWRGLAIHWRHGNFLRVALLGEGGRVIKHSCRTIHDVIGHYQTRFVRALEDHDIGTPDERALITRNKAERAKFERITREVRDYCYLECCLLARSMTKIREVWTELDIKPHEPSGAGKSAAALLGKWNIIRNDYLTALPRISGIYGMAEAAFYGGRFELQRHGQIPGPLFSRDINSAYPAEMHAGLPCLEHGKWLYCSGDEIRAYYETDPAAIFVATVHFQHRARWGCEGMCGLPFRRGEGHGEHIGTICWPLEGWGTYWSTELRSAALLGARYQFGNGWLYQNQCDCIAFPDLLPLYLARKAFKQAGQRTTEKFLKLTINAIYGKLVQQIGDGPYRNPIWGGLITAGVRAKINRAIATGPTAVVMIATDGIVATRPLDLPLSDTLGEWEAKEHPDGLFCCQPGIYWDKHTVTLRTRGVSPAFFADGRKRRRFHNAWQRYAEASQTSARWIAPPVVKLPIHRFVGMPEAEARNKPELAGRWQDDTRAFAFRWSGKRAATVWEPGPCVRSYPLAGGPDWRSAASDGEPALLATYEESGLDLEDQPDYYHWSDDD